MVGTLAEALWDLVLAVVVLSILVSPLLSIVLVVFVRFRRKNEQEPS